MKVLENKTYIVALKSFNSLSFKSLYETEFKIISPESAFIIPEIRESRVDFPLPDFPIIATLCPSFK